MPPLDRGSRNTRVGARTGANSNLDSTESPGLQDEVGQQPGEVPCGAGCWVPMGGDC